MDVELTDEQCDMELLCQRYRVTKEELNRRADGRIEWICGHGVGHTIFAPKIKRDDGTYFEDYSHGCDGCCGKFNNQAGKGGGVQKDALAESSTETGAELGTPSQPSIAGDGRKLLQDPSPKLEVWTSLEIKHALQRKSVGDIFGITEDKKWIRLDQHEKIVADLKKDKMCSDCGKYEAQMCVVCHDTFCNEREKGLRQQLADKDKEIENLNNFIKNVNTVKRREIF